MANDCFLKWQKENSVGIFQIDKQHKEIIALINDLSRLSVIDDEQSYGTFKIMLLSAIEYFSNHFWDEEKHMLEKKFPEYLLHKEQHKQMVQVMRGMVKKIGIDKNVTIKSIVEYLKEWYKSHLLGYDKEMGEYFIKRRQN